MSALCECCGQPGGVCPGCGLPHSPALGVRACEQCCTDPTYRGKSQEALGLNDHRAGEDRRQILMNMDEGG